VCALREFDTILMRSPPAPRGSLARLVERLAPGGRLIRMRRLRGGVGARMHVLEIERADLLSAPGRVLAEDVRSRREIPPWANSSMDGYAVRAADTGVVELAVVGRIIAGSMPSRTVGGGETMRIFTGAPLPDGADAVVPQEDVVASDGVIRLAARVDPGAYVRPAGEDVRVGDRVLEAGAVLTRVNEPGEDFFFIVDGSARVDVPGANKEIRLSPGEFFGEMSLLDGGPRTATVIAATAIRLLVIKRRHFATLLREVPALSLKICATLARRLRNAERRLSSDSTSGD
jgi:hypothetical protein